MQDQAGTDIPISSNSSVKRGGIYRRFVKRPMDLLLSLTAILILSPLLFTVALAVGIRMGRPVLFKQQRPGLREKIFTLYKFRTMTDARDKEGKLQPDGIRLTRFGKFLRATSLDELPELFNILKGEMSLVGPRPLLVQYLPLYNEHQKRRHELRPGLTGLAQVSGRNAISWEEKFDLDVAYVDHVTFAGDWSILFRTIKKVLKSEGISAPSQATAEVFEGRKRDS